jgi:hypothetical protein
MASRSTQLAGRQHSHTFSGEERETGSATDDIVAAGYINDNFLLLDVFRWFSGYQSQGGYVMKRGGGWRGFEGAWMAKMGC